MFLASSFFRFALLTAIVIGTGRSCFAQLPGFGIEANLIGGKVVKHEAKFTLPIPKVTTGFDANLVWHTYGNKAWHQRRRYPTVGLGFSYISYGIPEVYGNCLGLYPNVLLPLYKGKQIEWTLRIGDGIGYVTRTYGRKQPADTINKAIGSHLNDFAMILTDIRYHVNQHWDLQAGANITHISNGSYNKPNLGINMIGAHIGLRYFPVTSSPTRIVRDLKPATNRWLMQGRISVAMVSAYSPGGPRYPVYLATGYMSRRWRNVNKAFAGLDYSYHQSTYAYLRNNALDQGSEANNSWKSAAFVGNEFLLGRLGVVLQLGVYLRQSAIKLDPVYEKVGGHYYLVQKEHGPIKELFVAAFLKAHRSVAELGEIGLGFGF